MNSKNYSHAQPIIQKFDLIYGFLLDTILIFFVCIETIMAAIEIIVAERPNAILMIASLDTAGTAG